MQLCLHVGFLQYDPEGFGEIPWTDFVRLLSQPEFVQRIGAGKRDILLEKARGATTPAITFQDFVNVVSAMSGMCVATFSFNFVCVYTCKKNRGLFVPKTQLLYRIVFGERAATAAYLPAFLSDVFNEIGRPSLPVANPFH